MAETYQAADSHGWAQIMIHCNVSNTAAVGQVSSPCARRSSGCSCQGAERNKSPLPWREGVRGRGPACYKYKVSQIKLLLQPLLPAGGIFMPL